MVVIPSSTLGLVRAWWLQDIIVIISDGPHTVVTQPPEKPPKTRGCSTTADVHRPKASQLWPNHRYVDEDGADVTGGLGRPKPKRL